MDLTPTALPSSHSASLPSLHVSSPLAPGACLPSWASCLCLFPPHCNTSVFPSSGLLAQPVTDLIQWLQVLIKNVSPHPAPFTSSSATPASNLPNSSSHHLSVFLPDSSSRLLNQDPCNNRILPTSLLQPCRSCSCPLCIKMKWLSSLLHGHQGGQRGKNHRLVLPVPVLELW